MCSSVVHFTPACFYNLVDAFNRASVKFRSSAKALGNVITGCYLLVRRPTRFYYFGVILAFFQLRVLGFCSGTHLVSAPRSTRILGICRSASFDPLAFHAMALFRGSRYLSHRASSHKTMEKEPCLWLCPKIADCSGSFCCASTCRN